MVQEELTIVAVVILVDRQAYLPHVRLALSPVPCESHFLHDGQQQANQDRDDGNDDQQLDQGESTSMRHGDAPRNTILLIVIRWRRVVGKENPVEIHWRQTILAEVLADVLQWARTSGLRCRHSD
jgi:hypothetical protein